MTGIEFRTIHNELTPFCADCWAKLPTQPDPYNIESYGHNCEGIRDITVFRLELEQYEEKQGMTVHPIDFMEERGFFVMSYEPDQADYCAYISVKGIDQDSYGLPDYFTVSDHRPANNAIHANTGH